MKLSEAINLCEKYEELEKEICGENPFWKSNAEYWVPNGSVSGRGLTDAGWKKYRELEHKQNEILGNLGIDRLTDESDVTGCMVRRLLSVLKLLEVN